MMEQRNLSLNTVLRCRVLVDLSDIKLYHESSRHYTIPTIPTIRYDPLVRPAH